MFNTVFFKLSIILLAINTLSACNPTEKTAEPVVTSTVFSCLTSQSSCVIDTELGQIRVEFSGETLQGKLKTELPFHIALQFEGINSADTLQGAQGHLEGITMFMGKVPVLFQQNKVGHRLVASSLLASCHKEVMQWRLWLQLEIIHAGGVKKQAVFIDFDSIQS